MVKNLLAIAGNMGLIPDSERSVEKKMSTYSSILAWEISWTGTGWATVHGILQAKILEQVAISYSRGSF